MIQIPQANNTAITIYNYWQDQETGLSTYKRTYLERSHFDYVSASSKDKYGNTVTFDARLLIYDVSMFLPFPDFASLTADIVDHYWTLNPGTPTTRDQSFIVIGNTPYEFTLDEKQGLDAQMADFKKLFNNKYRLESVDPKLVGSERMRHIEAGLKRMV